MMKRKFLIALAALLAGCTAFSSAACGGREKLPTVGVLQYMTHASLNNCYTGFVQGLEEEGFVDGENIRIDYKNANGLDADNTSMAQSFADRRVSVLCAIATPSASAAITASRGDVPVVFTAVTDPTALLPKTNTYVTGTSDYMDMAGTVSLIRTLLPEATKIGIMFQNGAPNSLFQIDAMEEALAGTGITLFTYGINGENEAITAVQNIIGADVSCILNLNDNMVVNCMAQWLPSANEAKIPVFGSEEEQVRNGCIASNSLDYVKLGVQTGRIAARILRGERAGDIPYETIKGSSYVYSQENLTRLGVDLPEGFEGRNLD